MKRNLKKLSEGRYDLLIVGGGINGACAAWDATLRGLSVALVDKGDFGGATSAATGKMIHGGIRFLQYGAFWRTRESLHERMVMQKIAPQFVHPIPFLIPTYGHAMKGKEILALVMGFYELLNIGKRECNNPQNKMPVHRILSRDETLSMEPDINSEGLTGSVLYYDCQMHSPERLTLAFLQSAGKAGADIANYVEVKHFLKNGKKVEGAVAEDVLSGEEVVINSKMVLNATGPWLVKYNEHMRNPQTIHDIRLSKGIHIVTKSMTRSCALALATENKNAKSALSRGGRHFVIAPWRGHSLIGTTNVPFKGDLDGGLVTEKDITDFIREIRSSFAPLQELTIDDVLYSYGGLYPDDISIDSETGYQGNRKDRIIDHSVTDGMEGIISCTGVKYTTARRFAQDIIDIVYRKLGYSPPKCNTETAPLYGGDIERFDEYVASETGRSDHELDDGVISQLIYNYGSTYKEIFSYNEFGKNGFDKLNPGMSIIKNQVVHAVKEEMAQKLTDTVFRRTGFGTAGFPGEDALKLCASIMAGELGWDDQRTEEEVAGVKEKYFL